MKERARSPRRVRRLAVDERRYSAEDCPEAEHRVHNALAGQRFDVTFEPARLWLAARASLAEPSQRRESTRLVAAQARSQGGPGSEGRDRDAHAWVRSTARDRAAHSSIRTFRGCSESTAKRKQREIVTCESVDVDDNSCFANSHVVQLRCARGSPEVWLSICSPIRLRGRSSPATRCAEKRTGTTMALCAGALAAPGRPLIAALRLDAA